MKAARWRGTLGLPLLFSQLQSNKIKIKMLTDDESSHLHWVITIQIMKFFDTYFEIFGRNLLINKEKERKS